MILQLHDLKPNLRKRRQRVGRGIAAGQGKTAGRGTKGQKSRAGFRRIIVLPNLPKLKGFKSRRIKPITVNWQRIKDHFNKDEKVSAKKLEELGWIKKGERFKLVGRQKNESA